MRLYARRRRIRDEGGIMADPAVDLSHPKRVEEVEGEEAEELTAP
jgi:hypothetical protein